MQSYGTIQVNFCRRCCWHCCCCCCCLLRCFALQTVREGLQRATVSLAANRHDTGVDGIGDFSTIDLMVDLAQKHRWVTGLATVCNWSGVQLSLAVPEFELWELVDVLHSGAT